jgi:hypothetical protein
MFPIHKYPFMNEQTSTEWLEHQVKDLCVKTYLEILGYGCLVSSRGYAVFPILSNLEGLNLYVSPKTNQWRFGVNGTARGGVLELASLKFEVSREEILRNPTLYRIDVLLMVRGGTSGAVWHRWYMPGQEPERTHEPPPIPQRFASFFKKP